MTHTLHRKGKPENLREDFVVFTISAQTVNAKGSGKKIQKFFDILEKYKSINYGDMRTGNKFSSDRETIHNNIKDNSVVHFVFIDREVVKKVLQELKQAELGPSIVVSGLTGTIGELCEQTGLKVHTIEYSGGIHGKLDLLPEDSILEITTMCGHGMVASNLTKEMVKQVKKGKKTLEAAAIELAKPCQCGIFNPKRAETLLKELL